MKTIYRCDHCSFTTDDLEKMTAHEKAHMDTEALINTINGLIDEHNRVHGDSFRFARYIPNLPDRSATGRSADPAAPRRESHRLIFGDVFPDPGEILSMFFGGEDSD